MLNLQSPTLSLTYLVKIKQMKVSHLTHGEFDLIIMVCL